MTDSILAIEARTNARLMRQCFELGYLNGIVLDMTYGLGAFWNEYLPPSFIAMDLLLDAEIQADARALPFRTNSIDSVVFDPPYKLNGTSTGIGPSQMDSRFGVANGYESAAYRHSLLLDGTSEALRVSNGFVLVKCMDQISSGKYNPQTFMVWERATKHRAVMVDCLHVVGYREQPNGTRQLHARRNHSTLLVFDARRSL